MNIEIEKEIVNALPSLYPLQDYEEEAIDTIIKAIPHWIPVSEQEPPLEKEVLVCEDGGDKIWKDFIVVEDGIKVWYYFDLAITALDIAWMPLPDPWKG